jgi:UDP-glucose 4-epimerase
MLKNKGFNIATMDMRVQPKTNEKPNFSNILDEDELSKAVKNIVGIVHLAAISRVVTAEVNPELCCRTNVDGLKNLMHLSKKQPQKPWIIFASSREIYGEPSVLPVNEKHVANPINVYGNCKKAAEEVLMGQTNLSTIIFRFSNVYGSPFDYSTRVIPAFLWGTLNDKPLRVDSPNHVFDFTHVKDAARAIVAAVEKLTLEEFEGHEIFNLSTGKGTSLTQLIDVLKHLTGKDIETVAGKNRDYDVTRYIGDCSKVKRELGFQCQISLKEGLDLMLEDCQKVWRLSD